MKKISIILFAAVAAIACKNNNANNSAVKDPATDTANFTTVQWIDSSINFGEIEKGKTATVKFRCKNTGTKSLIIVNVQPGCGCTVADYTKTPVAPNGEGEVTALFDSKKVGTVGEVHKSIFVTTNTLNGYTTLSFSGTINDKNSQ